MPGLIFANSSEVEAANNVVANFNADGIECHLYQNNYTPTVASVLADFTEATFSGYAAVTAILMGSATLIGNFGVSVAASTAVFTHGVGMGSNTIYGYYVKDTASGKLIWSERFTAPVTMASNGDTISITLELDTSSRNT